MLIAIDEMKSNGRTKLYYAQMNLYRGYDIKYAKSELMILLRSFLETNAQQDICYPIRFKFNLPLRNFRRTGSRNEYLLVDPDDVCWARYIIIFRHRNQTAASTFQNGDFRKCALLRIEKWVEYMTKQRIWRFDTVRLNSSI